MGRSGLVFVLVALLAGVAIGYVIGSGSGTDPAFTETTREGVPKRPPEEPGERAPQSSAADHASLESWISAITAPAVSKGDAVISGTVRTEDGQPLAGVTIRARPVPPGRAAGSVSRGGPPPDDDLLTVVRRTVKSYRRRMGDRREVRTGADGAFRFTGLADLPHSVRAWAEGYRLETPGVSLWRVPPGSTLEFVATPRIVAEVVVLLPDGSPPETADLSVDGGGNRRSGRGWRPDDSEIELAPGTWTISAKAGKHREFWSEEVRITIEAGRPGPTIELPCRAVRGIRGRVIFPEVNKDHFKVAALRLAPGTTADPDRLTKADRSENLWGGRDLYTLLDLPAGRWLVGVVLDHRRVVAHGTVEVAEGLSVLDLAVPAPDPSEYVEVTVLGPEGEPVEKAHFSTEYETGNAHSGGGGRAREIGKGRWRVYHHVKPSSYDDGGRYGVEVKVTEYGSRRVWYDRKTTRKLTVRFDAPATFVATISGYVGCGLEGQLSLSLQPLSKDRGDSPGGRLSAEGEQRFGPTPPGAYELTLLLKRSEHNLVPVSRIRVDLKAGENRHTVLPPKLHRLTVLTEGLPEDIRLSLRPRDRSGGWWGTDRKLPENGRIVFDRLPAGDYVIEAGMQMMFVSVPGKAMVRFVASVINAMEVRIRQADGALANAGLRDGDLIVGVDGVEFRDLMHISSLLTGAMSKESTKLTVIRGGRKVVLEMNLGKIMRARNQGGKMEPASR